MNWLFKSYKKSESYLLVLSIINYDEVSTSCTLLIYERAKTPIKNYTSQGCIWYEEQYFCFYFFSFLTFDWVQYFKKCFSKLNGKKKSKLSLNLIIWNNSRCKIQLLIPTPDLDPRLEFWPLNLDSRPLIFQRNIFFVNMKIISNTP